MPTPKQKRIIVLLSSNHDSESGSLRDAIAAAGDESAESEDRDTLTGVDSEVRPIFTNTPLPFPASNPSPAFTDTIDGEVFSSQVAESDGASSLASVPLTIVGSASLVTNTPLPYNVYTLTSEPPVLAKTIGDSVDTLLGDYSEASHETDEFDGFPGLSAIGPSQEAVSEFSGVSSVEATILLPAVQKVREAAHRRLSEFITGGIRVGAGDVNGDGFGSSDGAWALGSTFELTSGVPFSSQTETSGRTFFPPGGGPPILWPPR